MFEIITTLEVERKCAPIGQTNANYEMHTSAVLYSYLRLQYRVLGVLSIRYSFRQPSVATVALLL